MKRNPNVKYLPIPSCRPSKPATPRTPTSPSQAKRSRCSELSIDPTNNPSLPFTVPSELEKNVKEYLNGTCVITGFNNTWGGGVGGGRGVRIEACHIFPRVLWNWWGYHDSGIPNQDRWYTVNSHKNCMIMEAFSHCVHGNRLLAIHPVSMKAPYPGFAINLE